VTHEPRRPWTESERDVMRARYPHERTADIARDLGRRTSTLYAMADQMGLRKTPERLAEGGRLRKGQRHSPATEFKPGQKSWNKGTRYTPGGRSVETQFKPGHWPAGKDRDYYVLGALRVNADGYIDMRTSFEPGRLGWTALHRILWEDAHGPIPPGHAVCFINGDPLDCELANLELVSRADLLRRNSVHNYPKPLVDAIRAKAVLTKAITRRTRRNGKATAD